MIRNVRADLQVEGDLSVCFADGMDSCVSGAFSARYCPIAIDAPVRGTQVMEHPPERKGAPAPAGSADAGATESGSVVVPPQPSGSAAVTPPPTP